MDSPVVKKIFLSIAVLLAIVVVTFAVNTTNKTKPLEQTSDQALTTINQNFASNQYSSYDGQIVSGSDVISVINTKASPDITITVTTKANSSIPYNAPNYNVTDIDSKDYIEPTAAFMSEIKRTTNGTINKINFVQQ